MRVDVWISIGVNIDVDDPKDNMEIAEKAYLPVMQKIQEDRLYGNIEEVTPYDPDEQEDNSPDTLRYRDDGGTDGG